MDIADPGDEGRAAWATWVSERPDSVRNVIEKYGLKPWTLYRMKPTGHRVTIASFDEQNDDSVTVRVDVTKHYNFVAFERRVFGVKPDDLEECDLPADDELLGSAELPIQDARLMVTDSIRAHLLEMNAAWPVDTPTTARKWFMKNASTMSPATRATASGYLEHWARIEMANAKERADG